MIESKNYLGLEILKNGFHSDHFTTDGLPDGGVSFGTGFSISWQRGALRNDDGTFKLPNGAFIEDIIDAALNRLEYHQDSPFACEENAQAIILLKQALEILDNRTKRRESTGKLGYQEVDDA
jgi:hypothetical protein